MAYEKKDSDRWTYMADFLLLGIFLSVTWQLGLVEREVQDMLDGKHSRTVKSKTIQKKSDDALENEEEVRYKKRNWWKF